MKRVLLTLFAAAIAAACSNSDEVMTIPVEAMGRIKLGVSASNAIEIIDASESRAETVETVEIPEEFVPAVDDFKLTITGTYYDPTSETTKDFYQEYENVTAYNSMEIDASDPTQSAPPYLVAGEYTAVLEYGEGVDVESATNAHFRGEISFEIIARKTDSEATITATLQNSMIKLRTTEYFDSYFAGGAKLILSTTQNSQITIDTTVEDEMDGEVENKVEKMLFVSPNTTLYLEGEGIKQDPGDGGLYKVVFEKSEIGVTKAQTLSTVVVDADDAGGCKIEVSVDDSYTEIHEQEIDLH